MKKLVAVMISAILLCGTIITPAYAEEKKEEEIVNCYRQVWDAMTDDEKEELRRIVWLECGFEPFEGQVGVVEVIFNRVIAPAWPNTVHEVLSAKRQFSTWKNVTKVSQGAYFKPYKSTVDLTGVDMAIAYAVEHGRTVLPYNYVFFATYKANGTDFIKIGHHYFGKGKVGY